MPRPLRRLLAGLLDDASLFPPRSASMEAALQGYAEHRAAPYAALVGPFLCPTSRVEELLSALPTGGGALALSLVVDSDSEGAHAALRTAGDDPRLSLVAVEARMSTLGPAAAQVGANVRRLPGATGFLEVERSDPTPALELVGDAGWHAAKLRTGGETPDAFPPEEELAALLGAVTERGLAFKLTAGLHHAVRSSGHEGSGEQHGLLNVLVATADVLAREDPQQVVGDLAERSADVLADRVRSWAELDCLAIRGSLRSIGCCEIGEPVAELAALGLLPDGP
jgi:hypothetical protein